MVQRLCSLLFTKTTDELVNDKIVRQLKEKMDENPSRDMKIKILSVLPNEWSAQKIQKKFGDSVTIYIINQAKTLVEKNGILCGTSKKIGSKTITEATVNKVIAFYNKDEISRACPAGPVPW